MIIFNNSICYYLLSLIILYLHDDADVEDYIIIIVKTLLMRGPTTLFNNETYHYCDDTRAGTIQSVSIQYRYRGQPIRIDTVIRGGHREI